MKQWDAQTTKSVNDQLNRALGEDPVTDFEQQQRDLRMIASLSPEHRERFEKLMVDEINKGLRKNRAEDQKKRQEQLERMKAAKDAGIMVKDLDAKIEVMEAKINSYVPWVNKSCQSNRFSSLIGQNLIAWSPLIG